MGVPRPPDRTLSPLLSLRRITRSFGPVRALRGVDFSLAGGEVHALLGENGAGKSTLMHIAYGMQRPDGGTIQVGGVDRVLHSPRDARALGIGMVHQHFTTIEALTVEENIRLAVGPGARATAGATLLEGLAPGTRVAELTVAERQRLEIAKALATGARILLLDEPTAVLTPVEVEELLGLVRGFAREGGAVALITHKLPEVLAAADRVTVLRHGAVTFTGPAPGVTAAELARRMLEEPGSEAPAEPGPQPDIERRLDLVPRGVPGPGDRAVVAVLAGIEIRSGDLVGVAAVEGNGQRELLRALAGLESLRRGDVRADGRAAFVPEDRTTEGLIPELSVTENIVLGLLDDPRWAGGRAIRWDAARRRTAELLGEFSIQAEGEGVPAATLSGGNQQKVVLARALERRPRLLVAENPTRGLDIRATAEVHERLRAAAGSGLAVVVYSTDLDEVLGLATRVLVVRAGAVCEAPAGADRVLVGEMMLGVTGSSPSRP